MSTHEECFKEFYSFISFKKLRRTNFVCNVFGVLKVMTFESSDPQRLPIATFKRVVTFRILRYSTFT